MDAVRKVPGHGVRSAIGCLYGVRRRAAYYHGDDSRRRHRWRFASGASGREDDGQDGL